VNFNKDGSGTFSYQINMGKYKFTLENIMKLDSIGKFKIPSEQDVENELGQLQSELNKIEGVSNATFEADFEYYVFKIKGSFKNVVALNKAYTAIYNHRRKAKTPYIDAYKYEKDYFARTEKDPKTNIFARNSFLKENQFTEGKVMIVTRFEKPIAMVNNSTTQISKNGKAILTKCTAAQLLKQPSRINCKVNFK
jgi:hypothetical protein